MNLREKKEYCISTIEILKMDKMDISCDDMKLIENAYKKADTITYIDSILDPYYINRFLNTNMDFEVMREFKNIKQLCIGNGLGAYTVCNQKFKNLTELANYLYKIGADDVTEIIKYFSSDN